MGRPRKNPDQMDGDKDVSEETDEELPVPELKACPACGGEAKVVEDVHGMKRCYCQACGFWDCPAFETEREAAEARKRQKVIEIKEIKMRPTIDDHDYDTKMRSMKRFFEEGDKVKVTLRFRGREMAHQHIGMELLTRIQKETDSYAKIEQYPRLEGRQMQMVLAPR